MTTLFRYLIGDREAILAVAGTRHSLWVGLLFVLSAGLAREYDGEDLLHEPWHALLPLAASVVSSVLLFTLAFRFGPSRDESCLDTPDRYLSFLGLFWMTAPLAWLYAVPYERFLPPVEAVRWNLITLGIVAAWRVALMVRVLVVILNYKVLAAVGVVMLFADSVALVLLHWWPVPIMSLMGGVRGINPMERLQAEIAVMLSGCGCWLWPVWLVCVWLAAGRCSLKWNADLDRSIRFPRVLGGLALSSVAVWAFVLPFTQPEQIRRHAVERDFAEGRIAEALDEMSQNERTDYPPLWRLPPARAHWPWLDLERMRPVLEELARRPHAEWVREAYLDRLADILSTEVLHHSDRLDWLGPLLLKIPDGPSVVQRIEVRKGDEWKSDLPQAIERARRQAKPAPP